MSGREDKTLEALLEALEQEPQRLLGAPPEDVDEAVWAECRELIGLLPYSLAPDEPSMACRQRMLQRVMAESAGVTGDGFAEVTPLTPRDASVGTLRTWQALAAVLACVVLGLAALSGWMYTEMNGRVEGLRNELALRPVQPAEPSRDLALPVRLPQVMTKRGMKVCPLKAMGEQPTQPDARGLVYLNEEMKEYLLTARDLKPCDRGSVYQVWFFVDGRPVAGRAFHVGEGDVITLMDSMPDGTEAVGLTLEPEAGRLEPGGPMILFGDQSMEMF